MPGTRNPDSVDLHATVAERVRKLEVMPNPRTIGAPKWRPAYDDLYAIAGHVYMLGCFDNPYQPGTPGYAFTSQAAQYLWATLDQRGFRSRPEGEDWTLFLKRLGALPVWDRYRAGSVIMSDSALSGAQAAECRPAQGYSTWVRTAWAQNGPDTPYTNTRFGDRALYWHGLPVGQWDWIKTPTVLPDPDPNPLPYSDSSYLLWEGTGPCDEGVFKAPFEPTVFQGGSWVNSATGTTGACFPDDRANPYIAGQQPGTPYTYGQPGCPDAPPSATGDDGITILARMIFTAHDLSLLAPPRLMDPALPDSDYRHPIETDGGTPHGTNGPGLEWLADGAAAILPDHPYVSGFYSDYLPIAYNNKLRAHHYNWQQLQVGIEGRGRVEAHKEPDRVILKGRIELSSEQLGVGLFQFPADWPLPALSFGQGIYVAGSDQGPALIHTLGVGSTPAAFYLEDSWVAGREGPLTVSLDGMVIPLELPAPA